MQDLGVVTGTEFDTGASGILASSKINALHQRTIYEMETMAGKAGADAVVGISMNHCVWPFSVDVKDGFTMTQRVMVSVSGTAVKLK